MNTIEAVRFPWAFSQRSPLSTQEFCRAAEARGVDLDEGSLRELYRHGLLIPFVEVRNRRVDSATPPLAPVGEPLARGSRLADLQRCRDLGRLIDPGESAFRPKLRFERRASDSLRWWNGLLYSHDQLLGLQLVRRHVEARRLFRRGDRIVVRMHTPDRCVVERAASLRRLAALLVVLEARYLPKLDPEWVHVTNADLDDWDEFRRSFEPIKVLHSSGWTHEEVRSSAENLLFTAHRHDVLGKWTDLIKRSPRRTWEELKGEPRVAMDHRVAAEILMLFHADLAEHGACQPIEPPPSLFWGPLNERLGARIGSLDESLSRLGVSPHPRVVLVIEGETERLMVERLMDVLDLRADSEVMRVLVLGGVTHDLTKLAAFAAAPLLGDRSGDDWEMIRPPTRLVIAVDPDQGFRTEDQVRRQRRIILDEIAAVVRAQGADPDRDDLASLVQIRTWEGGTFEFAHFTDTELAEALRSVSPTCNGLTDARLLEVLSSIRAKRGKIDTLVGAWKPAVSKIELARALLPTIERNTRAAISCRGDPPPLATAIDDAHYLARSQAHGTFVLRATNSTSPGQRR